MLKRFLATTAIAALCVGAGHAQTSDQPVVDEQRQAQNQQQSQQAQAQRQVTVSSGETVTVEARQGDEVRIDLRIQSRSDQQQASAGASRDDGQAAQRDTARQEDRQSAERQQNLQEVDVSQISADNLIGTTLYSERDEDIGDVGDVLLSEDGEVDSIVVDIGGFLGVGERQVALGIEDLRFMRDEQENMYVYVPYTREQFEGAREYDQATWSDERDQQRMTRETAQATGQQADTRQDTARNETGSGEQHVVNGGTVLVRAEQENVQLNFRVARADEAQTDQQTTGAVDRGQMRSATPGEFRAEELIGSEVYGANEENVGNVGDIVLTEEGELDAIVVDVGGFLGMGTHEVALGLDQVEFMQDDRDEWHLYTQYTEEQLEQAREYDASTYAERRDEQRLSTE